MPYIAIMEKNKYIKHFFEKFKIGKMNEFIGKLDCFNVLKKKKVALSKSLTEPMILQDNDHDNKFPFALFYDLYKELPITYAYHDMAYYDLVDEDEGCFFDLLLFLKKMKQYDPEPCILHQRIVEIGTTSLVVIEFKPGLLIAVSDIVTNKDVESNAKKIKNSNLMFKNFEIFYSDENKDQLDKIVSTVKECAITIRDHEYVPIELIAFKQSFIFTKEIDIHDKIKNIDDYDLHYKAGFYDFYKNLTTEMQSDKKGIVLFHGLPGTGKTNLIRNIVRELKDQKRFLFLPPNQFEYLSNPNFITFLLDDAKEKEDKNICLIIEDAESLLQDRYQEDNYNISTILNITDGLLNDIFSLQVIATFNIELNRIDEALLRNDRLIARKEFGKLSIDEANSLIEHLGVNTRAEKEMTLAEIYSMDFDKKILYHNLKNENRKEKLGFY